MQKLINHWSKVHYTEPLLLLVLCIAFVIAIKHRNKYRILRFFPLYMISLILAFITFLLPYFIEATKHWLRSPLNISSYADYLFTLIEMIIFSHFYFHLTRIQLVRQLIVIVNMIFFLFFIIMFFKEESYFLLITERTESIVYTVEAVLLLVICSFYFFELYKKKPYLNLKNEPSFWISTGLLFFLACTLPYSLLENYIAKHYPGFDISLYSIFYIFYILLFLMIIRAYLCKPEKMI
jgi:hypothetical protein